MPMTVLIAGATGLVGSSVTRVALADPRFGRVITWGRRATDTKAEYWGPASTGLLGGLRNEPVDAVICCLGTTMKNVGGNKEAFLHVDRDLVLGLGTWAASRSRFCIVSSMGTDANSRIFYNRVKGEVEQTLRSMDLPALRIFRPSILDGPRKEVRFGERLGLATMKALSALLPKDYRPMPHDVLAQALVNAAADMKAGTHQYTYEGIRQLAEKKPG